MTVLFIGDSNIGRFEQYLGKRDPFDVDSKVSIDFYGISGGCITKSNHVALFGERIAKCNPSCVVMLVGGNDIDAQGSDSLNAELTALRIITVANLWLQRYKLHNIFVCQLTPRKRTRNVTSEYYNILLKEANIVIKRELIEHEHIHYWNLKGMKNSDYDLLKPDGVHFSDIGLEKLRRNVRGIILNCLRQL